MSIPTPGDLRRGAVLRADKEAFTHDGAPLGERHLTTQEGLLRLIGRIGRTFDLLPNARHLYTLDPTLVAARLAVDAYVLPPHYLRLTLRRNFVVESNNPSNQTRVTRFVDQAGPRNDAYAGRWVAAHHIGLALHRPGDDRVYFSTLAPDTRKTTPVVIGVPYDQVETHVKFRDTAEHPPTGLLDPLLLLDVASRPVPADVLGLAA